MNVSARISAVRARLEGAGVDAMLVCDPSNVAYLTGFDGVFDGEDAHALVITPRTSLIYTDSRYAEAVTAAAAESEWAVRLPRQNLYVSLCEDLADAGVSGLAIEESVAYGRFRFVSERFSGNVLVVDQWVEEVRQSKEPEEVARIRAAQELTDGAFEHILDMVRPGAVERDIALELEVFMRKAGSDGVAFPPIVASGENSSRPHAHASHRVIRAGDFVKMDFGARVDGYCADMTRTVVVGTASARHREIYDAVLAANLAGIAALRPGVPGSSVDAAARSVLEAAGFGEYFGHGLGHGVGLDVHELPAVGPRASKSLLPGSVVTIEPGVYVPGFGGVRIEDLVLVSEPRVEVLTRSTKELLEL